MTTCAKANGGKRGRGKPEPVACWACGTPAPSRNRLGPGWHRRRIRVCHAPMTEVNCPDCFAEWGWVDPPEPLPYEASFPGFTGHARGVARKGRGP